MSVNEFPREVGGNVLALSEVGDLIADHLLPAIDFLALEEFSVEAPVGSEFDLSRKTILPLGIQTRTGIGADIYSDDQGYRCVHLRVIGKVLDDDLTESMVVAAGLDQPDVDEEVRQTVEEGQIHAWRATCFDFYWPDTQPVIRSVEYQLINSDGNVVWTDEEMNPEEDPAQRGQTEKLLTADQEDELRVSGNTLEEVFSEADREDVVRIFLSLGVPGSLFE